MEQKIIQIIAKLKVHHKVLSRHERKLNGHDEEIKTMNRRMKYISKEVSEVLVALEQLLHFKTTLDDILLMIKGGIKVAKWFGVAMIGTSLAIFFGWERFLIWLSV